MKTKKYLEIKPQALELNDRAEPFSESPASEAMVRTQIYLTRAEQEFLAREASRRGQALSAVLRGIIDEKMAVPEEAWQNNPMLEPTPDVAGWEGHQDGTLNHDHYIYGGPKKYAKKGGEWVLLPPITE